MTKEKREKTDWLSPEGELKILTRGQLVLSMNHTTVELLKRYSLLAKNCQDTKDIRDNVNRAMQVVFERDNNLMGPGGPQDSLRLV
ncbi:MAG: hypothetical protein Q8M40_14050 [Legionella sp.]|nr:hypothetical protein [Legionella sp.]